VAGPERAEAVQRRTAAPGRSSRVRVAGGQPTAAGAAAAQPKTARAPADRADAERMAAVRVLVARRAAARVDTARAAPLPGQGRRTRLDRHPGTGRLAVRSWPLGSRPASRCPRLCPGHGQRHRQNRCATERRHSRHYQPASRCSSPRRVPNRGLACPHPRHTRLPRLRPRRRPGQRSGQPRPCPRNGPPPRCPGLGDRPNPRRSRSPR